MFALLQCCIFTSESCSPSVDQVAHKNDIVSSEIVPDVIDFIFHVKPILSDRCFKCHGPDEAKIEGGLQLHSEEKAFAALGPNKDKYAIKKGDVVNSELVKRIYADNPDDVMPPPESNLTLSKTEKEILKKWIAQGAEWKEHWAFVPPSDPLVPTVQHSEWVLNPIDNFILEKLEDQKLQPSSQLSNEKLLRKVSFDLTGLPPSLKDIQSFLSDDSNENYERIVDKYLASKSFAERMTTEWLDLARYADTHGYQDDLERIMWPWRDWVIHAFDQNMPYDEFVTWQLAGDLIPNATKEQIIATAFNRNHKITQEGGVIPEEYRAEYVTDRTNTFGTAFLGMTFECAKCHDHKYDPISQKEYYQLFGFFNSIDEKGLIEEYGAIPEPYINLTKEEIKGVLDFVNNLDNLDTIPLMVMKEVKQARQTHVLSRGLYDQPSTKVDPTFPGFGKPTIASKKLNRLDLAQWLFGDENPLTARVTVNRFWQQIFGKGIVVTSYDFGNQGALPSHPELLDHLAQKFKKEDWSVKSFFKYLVTSSTYKQASSVSAEMLERDPENNLLARSSRTRLSAEMLRDHALTISGLLVKEVGGPSVKPYQPDGLWNEVTGGGGGSTAKYVQDEGDKNYRRSLYTFWKRTVPPPNMLLFDTPTRDFCAVKRENTSTPLQALVLMNDPQFLEASQALAFRALQNDENEQTQRIIQYMFTLATSRLANEDELVSLEKMYQEQLDYFESNPTQAVGLLSYSGDSIKSKNLPQLAAFSFVANTIFNLDETIRKI
jgi:hypothetical protein